MYGKKLTALLLALLLLTGCMAGGSTVEQTGETRVVTDSAGRQVEVPVDIDAVAPSGAWAQIVLFTLCPEKLIGLSDALSKTQKAYIDEQYWDLPVYGKFYGKNANMNYEAIIAAGPDVIIDIGEAKANIADDLDTLQQQTGIPVLFIECTLETTAEVYDLLGDILGVGERAGEMAAYTREVLALAEENRAKIPEGERVRVLYAEGEYGHYVSGAGSTHAEVLDVVGADNVAVLDSISSEGGDEVSMEQILLWDPEVVILAADGSYGDVWKDTAWQEVTAVQTGRVYEVPAGPYNWIDRPPSVQRILGILWLGNLLYPELYDYDMVERTQEFYALFFQWDLSREQAVELMANSTFLAG